MTSMINHIKTQLILFLFLSVSGCATLEDFQKMDAVNRAHYVCQHEKSYTAYSHEVNRYQNKVNTISETLVNGYKIQEVCRSIHYEVPDTITCTPDDSNKNKPTTCTQNFTNQVKKTCKEVIVPINIELEKENLERYQNWLEVALTKKAQAYDACYSSVLTMPAESAYSYYKIQ